MPHPIHAQTTTESGAGRKEGWGEKIPGADHSDHRHRRQQCVNQAGLQLTTRVARFVMVSSTYHVENGFGNGSSLEIWFGQTEDNQRDIPL